MSESLIIFTNNLPQCRFGALLSSAPFKLVTTGTEVETKRSDKHGHPVAGSNLTSQPPERISFNYMLKYLACHSHRPKIPSTWNSEI